MKTLNDIHEEAADKPGLRRQLSSGAQAASLLREEADANEALELARIDQEERERLNVLHRRHRRKVKRGKSGASDEAALAEAEASIRAEFAREREHVRADHAANQSVYALEEAERSRRKQNRRKSRAPRASRASRASRAVVRPSVTMRPSVAMRDMLSEEQRAYDLARLEDRQGAAAELQKKMQRAKRSPRHKKGRKR